MAAAATPRVAVVCGGSSPEAEVSRASGREVARALAQRLDDVTTIEHGPDLDQRLRRADPDVVFPVMHGPPGEDGTLQGFLETLELPYVGSGVRAAACAMHKPTAKALFRGRDLPVADDVAVRAGEDPDDAARRVLAALALPVVCKPTDQGSALGVEFCHEPSELPDALARSLAAGTEVLVETLVAGREVTVGVLEREATEVLPVIEIATPEGSWYDFEHRYTAGASEHLVPAPLDDEVTARLQEVARRAHEVLGCRDLSRADLILSPAEGPVLLEVNTIPGMTATSLFPDAAAAVGVDFPDLVADLARRAHARGPAPTS